MTPAHELAPEVELDRLRLVSQMVADTGPGWADGFRPGTSGCHELLDRANLMAGMLEQHVLNHPACVADADWYALAERAASAMRELYQRVGAEHLAVEEAEPDLRRGSGPDRKQHALATNQSKQQPIAPDRPEDSMVTKQDVELVAIWLHDAARSMGHAELVRSVLKRAADNAAGMYAAPGDHATMEDNDDSFGVRDALGRLSAKWDECERTAREDDAQN